MPHVSTPLARLAGRPGRLRGQPACPPTRTTAFMWTGSSRSNRLTAAGALPGAPAPPRARPGFTRRTPTFRRSVPSPCPATSKRRATASCSTSTPSTRGDALQELTPPRIAWEDCPVGSYVTEFDLAPALRGGRVCVSFQASRPAFYCWCNGQFVGYSEDSFTPGRL